MAGCFGTTPAHNDEGEFDTGTDINVMETYICFYGSVILQHIATRVRPLFIVIYCTHTVVALITLAVV